MKAVVHDFAAVEKRHKLRLPESCKQFIAKIGTKTFNDVDAEEGFCVHILPSQRVDFEEFRKMTNEKSDEEWQRIQGVVFATTDHGDLFCFDVAREGPDYPVYRYNHELDDFEPYAGNFAACVRRFSGG